MGLQIVKESMFHSFSTLVIWLWKSFGNIVKEVCTIHLKTDSIVYSSYKYAILQ